MTRPLAWLVPVLPLAVLASAPDAGAQSLEPPPPMPPGYPSQPAQPLPSSPPPVNPPSSDESQDSGLGLEWVWLNAEVGASYVNMTSFDSSTLGLQKTESSGPAFGVGAGVRLFFFTLGARARDLSLSSIGNLWMLNLEAALHTRLWRFDPYLGVRGGYNFVGSLNTNSVQVATGNSPPDVSVHGFNVGPMVGLDFYPLNFLSIGADFDAQFLFLQRPKPPLPFGVDPNNLPPQYKPYQQLYDNSGSSAGFGFTAAAHVGLHY